MFRFLVSAGLVLFSLAFTPAAHALDAPAATAWWTSATGAFARASAYVASRTLIRVEELDESGSVTSWERGETRLDWSEGQRRVVVVSAEKNGKDVGDDWRKRYEKAERKENSGGGPPPGFDATPFDPKFAQVLSRGETRLAGNVVEVPYTIATEGGTVAGTARFSLGGSVIGASQSWLKPPAFVQSMRSSLTYTYHDGALLISGMSIEGEASILFVKRRFRMSFEFADWKPSVP